MIRAQVVFLPIGEKSCGDAIVLRFGDLDSKDPQKIYTVLIDGGYTDDWQKVDALMRKNFKTGYLDLVVSTHPDQDHINGLIGVLQNIPVGKLWMHQPWEHSGDYLVAREGGFTSKKMTEWLQKSLQGANNLAAAAKAADVPVEEPFAGNQLPTPYGTLTVLGPSKEYYEELLPKILDKSAAKVQASALTTGYESLIGIISKGVDKVKTIVESHHIETLTDNGETTLANNSSTVLLFETTDGTKKWLFTGDAGIPALENAHAEHTARGGGTLHFVQVPHHGSKQNIGPSILDKWLGQRTPQPGIKRGIAYVSAGENCEKDGHPKKIALNAFTRRGFEVYETRGGSIKHGHPLDGFTGTIYPLPLYEEIYDDE
jgi:beta-lactamase superfamily II metal-dependent hydrolase